MFGLGMTEIFVIAVLAILVIAPKDLPAAMRTVAQTMAKAKRMWRNVQREFDDVLRVDELNDVRRQVADIRRSTDAEFMKSMQAPRTTPRSAAQAGTTAATTTANADAASVEPRPDSAPTTETIAPAPAGDTGAAPETNPAETAQPRPVEAERDASPEVRPVTAKA